MSKYKKSSNRLIILLFILVLSLGALFGVLFLTRTGGPTTLSADASSEKNLTVVTVSDKPVFYVSPYIFGVNLGERGYTSDYQKYTEEILGFKSIGRKNLRDMGMSFVRYPTGCTADFYDWRNGSLNYIFDGREIKTNWLSVEGALRLTRELGTELLYVVNLSTGEFKNSCNQTPLNLQNPKSMAEFVKNYRGRISYYQLGNEPYAASGTYKDDYGKIALEFAREMKKADPSIHITISGYPTNSGTDPSLLNWKKSIDELLAANCGASPCVDAVTDHTYVRSGYYKNFPVDERNFPGLLTYYPQTKLFERMSQRRQFFGKKMHLSEWNLVCWDEKYPTNTVEHGMFVWEALRNMALANVWAANLFQFNVQTSPTICGVTTTRDNSQFSAVAQAFKHISEIKGQELLPTTVVGPTQKIAEGTNCYENDCIPKQEVPYVSSLAVRKANSTFIYLANRATTTNTTKIVFETSKNKIRNQNIRIDALTGHNYSDDQFYKNNISIKNSKLGDGLFEVMVDLPPITIAKIELKNAN